MKLKAVTILITLVLLSSILLSGCGIAPEKYNEIAAKLSEALEEIAKMRSENEILAEEKEVIYAQLEEAQSAITKLEEQLEELVEQYDLVGANKAETAENIIRYYHETHVYSMYDLFICSDMASEVWNMLKAQGITAQIVIGNTEEVVSNILDSNHAWVLADVAPGEQLALETTGGFVVSKNENALYYRGWYFNSPNDLKSNNQLVREYNVRVSIHNELVAEDREVIEEHNRATDQPTADRLKAVHEKLVELMEMQQAEMMSIETEINRLANKCGG